MYTDPISDYLTRVRNAQAAGHRIVEIPASNLKKKITEKESDIQKAKESPEGSDLLAQKIKDQGIHD